ncbi:hypothetical protein [Methylocapsa aurea]|uniref:hypothetical protein n=1 Tax=Methylocapsa aurea TaxID=663610 RepID=UPI001FDA9568|nr:hypothetical protein [Methylocapsa aurea]
MGSGANFRNQRNELMGSMSQNCIPDFARGFAFDEKLAEFELTFSDPMHQFDAGSGD